MLHQRKSVPSPLCQNCFSNSIEKSSHVLRCRCRASKASFKLNVNKLIRPALTEHKTFSLLQDAIMLILSKWRDRHKIRSCDFPNHPGLQAAIKEQSVIGWYNFMLGRWSHKWQSIQQQHIISTVSLRSSSRWTAAIINKFMHTVWMIWQTRIDLKFGKHGTVQRSLHTDLDQEILSHF